MADIRRSSVSPPSGHGTEAGLVLLAIIWGVNFPLIKWALDTVPPLAFNALRFPLAALSLFLLVRILRGPLIIARADIPRVIALGLLGHLVYQALFILAVDRTSAGNASLVLATSPAWTVLLSLATKQETADGGVLLGVGATIVGMGLVVAGGAGAAFDASRLSGDLLMLAASVAWAGYTVGSRPLVQRYGSLPVTGWTLWVGTIGVMAIGLPSLAREPVAEYSPAIWAVAGYAGVLSISVAYALWNRSVRRIGNSRTAVYSNLVPVVALIAAWVALGERPTLLQVLGAAVILGGLRLTRRRPARADSGAAPRETRTAESRRG
ncbi:EamA family transporter [Gemmatimonadota bacterium DH-20]|uniref:EamA family transporter n=1 Tax=Gaopeijia maritima TaxID=3119007 RepID=A0ABU9E7D6_9BACT